MIWLSLFLFLFLITVARVRQQGVSWETIAAAFSQWIHFIFIGGRWGPTLSSCVGANVRDGHEHVWIWKILETIIDGLFWFKEYDHCAESLHRVETIERQLWISTQS